ncbi:Holliday junction branch migration protein RuvA [Corynebacterium minutissimum]|uniref:Holliday junction branch migration complex subunit RuvA n=1 Tax=Corynebacterium minutissimum TaxID=38301 RepID=A0A2X4RD45_9CORY|nr:Holliday junction branch migration protein RuvA [Corynebacterium minutissimum]KHO28528.1 ATP-dependent DNA helicase RuvA [Corynebacterium minutissimum]MCG7228268.1 Holliday junction branch migration protein RuvA [Corynebacterium minutissimum]MCG7238548.1 Holliday junction branch migration protein RuvA [Corynebacterium minutissimum]QPS59046.1 Holliday junction branch migration protein RuvA [Corynebacterium minutissimum]QQA80164.1 Holliday junction branch migration protein RuvA [Corynebacteri
MIASLRGTVLDIQLDYVVLECAGVGYKVLATPTTLGTLQRGEEAHVMTTLVVKEDSMTLYGFTSTDDRDMFHVLQTVSGLGPKLALAALSVMGAGDLAQAIAGEESARLQKIPGVGKRMAQRLVLELKDKVSGFAPALSDVPPATPTATGPVVDDVVEALVGLGFSDKAARPVVEAVAAEQPDAATPVVLRAALSQLGAKK